MAVQAQHPMVDPRNKAAHISGIDISSIEARTFLAPIPLQGNLLGDCAMQQAILMGSSSPIENMQRLSQQGASPIAGLMLPNFPLYQAPVGPTELDMPVVGSKRSRKESSHLTQNNMQKYQLQLGVDLNQTSGCSPVSLKPLPGVQNNVSTGLRLAFDDDRSTVTSSRPDSSSSLALKDELSTQLSQHQEELNQIIKAQAEQLRQALEERAQRQSKGFLAAVERGFSQRLRERDIEMERVCKRNIELEETVKQLTMESQMWQSKAKNNEAMVAILRTNLQQAMLLQHHNREQQSRLEGCGDSEVDDAASLYIDDNPHAQQMRAMASLRKAPYVSPPSGIMKTTPQSSMMPDNDIAVVRACRRCKLREATVVLLPCLHLSLCASCKDECERCPACNSLKSAGVEVFLS